MSTVNIPSELGSQIIQVVPPTRAFVLHNAKREPKSPIYVGTMFTLPAVHVVGPRAERDLDGNLIPGTIVLEDIYAFNEETGADTLVFDAAKAVQHVLGVKRSDDGLSAVADSAFSRVGISILPRRPSKEVWMAVARDGADRAFASEVDKAYELVNAVDSRNAKLKEAGGAAKPLTGKDAVEYERAKVLLNQHQDLIQRTVREEVAPHEQVDMDEAAEIAIAVKVAARKLADKHLDKSDTKTDREALARELLEDPLIRGKLERDYRIRKVGHRQPTREELTKAQESGAKVSDVTGGTETQR